MLGTLEFLESTVQKSSHWLKEACEELHWDEPSDAYHALRAVLHTLRDRLTVDEAADFAAQMPLIIRGMYYEGWDPSRTPVKLRTRQEWINAVEAKFQAVQNVSGLYLTESIFRLLSRRISAGEIKDVRTMLPGDVADLFPGAPPK